MTIVFVIQVLGIQATDLLAVRWGLQAVLLQDQGVPLPPKELSPPSSRTWMEMPVQQLYIFGTNDASLQLSFQF